MKVLSDAQLPPWLLVSDVMFNAAKSSRFVTPRAEQEPALITAEPKMPRISARYPSYGWQIFLAAGLDGVLDLGKPESRKTGKTRVEDDGYNLDAWLTKARIERASVLSA